MLSVVEKQALLTGKGEEVKIEAKKEMLPNTEKLLLPENTKN